MKFHSSLIGLIFCLGLFTGKLMPQDVVEADNLMLKGHYSDALKMVESIIQQDKNNPEAQHKAGLIYRNLMQYGKAMPHLETAAQHNSENLDIHYALGKNYFRLDRYADARHVLQKVFDTDSTHLAAGTYLGLILMKLREFEKADTVHLTLIHQDPTNAHVYKQLGISAFKQGNDSTSIAHIGKFSHYSDTPDPDVIYYIGKNDLRVGRVRSAITSFHTGTKYFPHRQIFYAELARLLYSVQAYEEAIEPFEKLIALGDSTAGVYQHLGFCYYYAENMVRARDAFRKSFHKDPSKGLTAFYLGFTERETGNLTRALEIFEKAEVLSYASYLGDLYVQMATAYEEKEQYESAIQSYTAAMDFSPDLRTLLFQIATIYNENLKDTDLALQYYTRFLNHPATAGQHYINHANNRVSRIKEKMFFTN